MEHPRPLGRELRVVDPLAVGGDGQVVEQRARQPVGQVPAAVHVAEGHGHLVGAAVARPDGDQLPVERDVHEEDRPRMVGRQRVRIHQHLVLSVRAPAHVQHVQVLVGAAPGEEVAPAVLGGRAHRVHLEQSREARLDGLEPRDVRHHRLPVAVLRIDPGARLGGVLGLEPAVRVLDHHAVERVADDLHPRGRTGRQGPGGQRGREGEGEQEEGRREAGDGTLDRRHGRVSGVGQRTPQATRRIGSEARAAG